MDEEILEVVLKRRRVLVGDKVRINKPNDPFHTLSGKVSRIEGSAFTVDFGNTKQFYLEKRLVKI